MSSAKIRQILQQNKALAEAVEAKNAKIGELEKIAKQGKDVAQELREAKTDLAETEKALGAVADISAKEGANVIEKYGSAFRTLKDLEDAAKSANKGELVLQVLNQRRLELVEQMMRVWEAENKIGKPLVMTGDVRKALLSAHELNCLDRKNIPKIIELLDKGGVPREYRSFLLDTGAVGGKPNVLRNVVSVLREGGVTAKLVDGTKAGEQLLQIVRTTAKGEEVVSSMRVAVKAAEGGRTAVRVLEEGAEGTTFLLEGEKLAAIGGKAAEGLHIASGAFVLLDLAAVGISTYEYFDRVAQNKQAMDAIREKLDKTPGFAKRDDETYVHTESGAIVNLKQVEQAMATREGAARLNVAASGVGFAGSLLTLTPAAPIGMAITGVSFIIQLPSSCTDRASQLKIINQLPPWMIASLGTKIVVGDSEQDITNGRWTDFFGENGTGEYFNLLNTKDVRKKALFSIFSQVMQEGLAASQTALQTGKTSSEDLARYVSLAERMADPLEADRFYGADFENVILPTFNAMVALSPGGVACDLNDISSMEKLPGVSNETIKMCMQKALDFYELSHREDVYVRYLALEKTLGEGGSLTSAQEKMIESITVMDPLMGQPCKLSTIKVRTDQIAVLQDIIATVGKQIVYGRKLEKDKDQLLQRLNEQKSYGSNYVTRTAAFSQSLFSQLSKEGNNGGNIRAKLIREKPERITQIKKDIVSIYARYSTENGIRETAKRILAEMESNGGRWETNTFYSADFNMLVNRFAHDGQAVNFSPSVQFPLPNLMHGTALSPEGKKAMLRLSKKDYGIYDDLSFSGKQFSIEKFTVNMLLNGSDILLGKAEISTSATIDNTPEGKQALSLLDGAQRLKADILNFQQPIDYWDLVDEYHSANDSDVNAMYLSSFSKALEEILDKCSMYRLQLMTSDSDSRQDISQKINDVQRVYDRLVIETSAHYKIASNEFKYKNYYANFIDGAFSEKIPQGDPQPVDAKIAAVFSMGDNGKVLGVGDIITNGDLDVLGQLAEHLKGINTSQLTIGKYQTGIAGGLIPVTSWMLTINDGRRIVGVQRKGEKICNAVSFLR